jgi:oxepin-CoA hydrolase/3-oxo-5,6-dehydrosuberyl-CoA semialdehyde dehydrogenase
MQHLASFVGGRWVEGKGGGHTLVNPASEEALATASSEGIDLAGALAFARDTGGPTLRALSFAERGAILKGMAGALQGSRPLVQGLAKAGTPG